MQLCVQAFEELAREGIAARVVSLPSWERFEEQDAQYRAQVLPPGITARVAVEAGAALGWERYAGGTGAIIAMRSFGGSAPIKDLMKKFGFTTEAVVRAAKAQLARSETMNPVRALVDHGQAVWLDFLSRELLDKGELARLIESDGVRGVTSNPTIFEKAIGHSADYDGSIRRLLKEERAPEQILEALMVEDIRHAADVLRPVFDATRGADGFVSIEVSPYLADDTKGTIAEAKRLWKRGGPREPHDQGARNAGGPARDPRADRAGHQREHHAALLAEGVRAGGRGLYRRPRGARRGQGRGRSASRAWRASS